MKKKITALLIMIFAMVLAIGVYAKDKDEGVKIISDSNLDVVEKYVKDRENIVSEVLKINLERDGYSISNAKIGHAFKVENANMYMFPVIINGDIVKFVQLTQINNSNEYGISVGDYFASELSELDRNNEYSIVADNVGNIYAVNDDIEVMIDCFSTENVKLSYIDKQQISNDKDVINIFDTLINLSENISVRDSTSRYNYNFVTVQQSTDKTCWAACMSSILKGYGINKSESNITSTLGKQNQSASTNNIPDYFAEFGLDSKYYGNVTSYNTVKSIIDAGGAVYQALAGTSSMGDHAVVIMGYSEVSGKYYAIMDPARGKYYDCIVNNSGVITHNTRMSADCVRDFSK